MIIKGLNIFITWKQYEDILTENVREKLSELPNVNPDNVSKALKQKNLILFEEIERKYKTKEKAIEFLDQWLKFDLYDKEAKDNTWNILNDYCVNNSFAILRDNRSFDNQLKADYLGESNTFYPLGKEFSIVCKIPEKRNWFGKRIENSSEVEIVIETEKVTRITGEFKSLFTIFTTEKKFVFGSGLSIFPIDG